MPSRILKLVSISVALLVIQACSHPIEIEGQGDVMSASGNRTCLLENFEAGDDVCSKNYIFGFDLDQLPALVPEDYSETYSPVPRSGWYFDRWEPYCATATGPSYDCSFNAAAALVQEFWGETLPPLKAVFVTQCGDRIVAGIEQCDDGNLVNGDGCEATCTLTPDADEDGIPDLADNCPAVANPDQADFDNDGEGDACDDSDGDGVFDASDECALDPDNLCIIADDIVTVNGREWAQPDLFTDLSWGEINQQCPIAEGGVCKKAFYEEDRLKGYNMEGWVWASMDDVNGLFNHFLAGAGVSGDDLLSGREYYVGYDYGGWGTDFFNAGFRGTVGPLYLEGLVSTFHGYCCEVYVGTIIDLEDPEPDWAQVFYRESSGQPDMGAFFYYIQLCHSEPVSNHYRRIDPLD